MVDEYLDLRVPSTTRRVDGAEELVGSREDRRANEGSGETGVKLKASREMGRQTTTSSCGKRVSGNDTGGVGAADHEDSCKDRVIESDDDGGEDEQLGARGDFEKSQKTLVAGVAEEGWHRQVAEAVVDGAAEASGAKVDAGCVVDSVGAKGTRGASRETVSRWVVGKPTERGWRVWCAGAQHRCRW